MLPLKTPFPVCNHNLPSCSPTISRSTTTFSPPSVSFSPPLSLTLDWTSALWSFWSSSAADFVSSLRAAMCRAGRRTLPLVSCSNSRETTELWPCWRAMASGVKPSWMSSEEEDKKEKAILEKMRGKCAYECSHYTQTNLCCNALVPFIFQQVSHHLQVVLLGCHVEWSEAIL